MSVSSSTSSPPKRYSIVEPHPSVPSSHYFSTGRGGAGNVTRAPPSTTRGSDATGPAARVSLISHPSHPRKNFVAGRGGAGNVHPSSERAIFSFDEELERQLSQERHAAPVYHVGRGGAGNLAHSPNGGSSTTTTGSSGFFSTTTGGRRSTTSGRPACQSSTESESGADVFNRGIKKRWNKLMGVGY
ncbi:hypothetical protein PV08_10404 [Exophiala spinifera]|uniref:Uncharacterized protein n=1 Tax=Exophiala spinifera TaxID=91928 RepID=A0A0D2BIC0_9EURO|nr:uncharacterized protein PV08_10404 [Exophiala spinifera]KIW11104.1 hypothetical protein PV08_10404 [Exophiala spinifera]